MRPIRITEPVIGYAWTGRHVVILQCRSSTNTFFSLHSSLHALLEPSKINCAETLSQLLSIGYQVASVTQLQPDIVQYLLVM
ncbi:hypothetical protein ACFFIX_09545 [Metabacillus herbersteinensis]|uniref:Uncharacterized protein n=1 Tax=Metabacillus herbersteinensis TaxID=283816 RepID=A0ABV6GDD8_9BACI